MRRTYHLKLEALEERALPSRFDGSFDTIGLTALRADANYRDVDGSGVGIAIVDTGVYAANPNLLGNFVHWYDAVQQRDGGGVAASQNAAFDPDGHGSHVAGIAASSNPDIGVAPRAQLIGIRALPADGEAYPINRDPVTDGLQWVLQHYQEYNIKVVNLSLGVSDTNINQQVSRTQGEAYLVDQLERHGITVVSASGNSYGQFAAPGATAPAIYSTISVANTWSQNGQYQGVVAGGSSGDFFYATTRDFHVDQFASTSQRSSLANQVAAPGQQIFSAWNGDGGQLTNTLSGTSMATPLVSGVVALMQDAAQTYGGRSLSPAEVLNILQTSADTILDGDNPTNGRVPIRNGQLDFSRETNLPETGLAFRRVNAHRAIQLTRQVVTGSAPAPNPTPTPTPGVDTNNTIATSIVLPNLDGSRVYTSSGVIGQDGQVLLGVNDVDLYKIVLNSPGTVTFQVSPISGGVSFDPYLRLFDSDGRQLARVDDTQGAFPTLASQRLQAGTYYFGVSSFANAAYSIVTGAGRANGQSQGNYGLIVTLTNPDPNGIQTGAQAFAGLPESFNGVLDSDPPPIGSNTRIQVGAKDVDMFEVLAPDDGTLVVDVNAATVPSYGGLARNGGQAVDSYLRVFDAAGAQLAFNDDFGGTTDSFLRLRLTRGQQVFVAISDYANRTYDPRDPYTRSSLGTGGLYDLSLGFDNGDQNGTIGTATGAVVGQPIQADVGKDAGTVVGKDGSKDVDFYQFISGAEGLLDFAVQGLGGLTPSLSIWTQSAAGDFLRMAEETDGAAELILRVRAGQTFYVAVSGQGNSDFDWFAPASGSGGSTGSYRLQSTLRPLADLSVLSDGQINGSSAVRTIALGQSLSDQVGRDGSYISGAADVDLFRFVAPSTLLLQVATDSFAEGSSNTFLRLFDASGKELAYNNDADPRTVGSLIQFAVIGGQTYYIGVNGAGNSPRNYDPLSGAGAEPGSQGTYVLTVSQVENNDNRLFVSGLYHDLLGRAGDASSVKMFEGVLRDARGPVLTQVAIDYAASDEARAGLIREFYSMCLARTPLPRELSYWGDALRLGATPEQVLGLLLTSAECQERAGSLSGWLDSVYRDILGRARRPGETTFLDAIAGGSTIQQVVDAILTSAEYRNRVIVNEYAAFLRRQPQAGELDYWRAVYGQAAATPAGRSARELVLGGILGAAEYVQRQGNTLAGWLTGLYVDLLGRQPDAGGYSSTVGRVLAGYAARRNDVANVLLASPEYREKRIQEDYQRLLSRSASKDEVSYWLSLQHQGQTSNDILAAILASDEHFAKHGGAGASWLDALYREALGRNRDASEVFFLNSLNDGGGTRLQIAAAILASAESNRVVVQRAYASYLGRSASEADVAYWQGSSADTILGGILASAEYFGLTHPAG